MAIENNLLHFETEETFQSERNDIKEQSITFVQDSKKIYTHGKEYCMVNWGTLEEQNYVDLGLPSGLKWAKCNIGASTPEESGLYFQWGDTQGYTAEQVGRGEGQKAFTWNDYKFGTPSNLTKYNSSDGKTVLDPEDDATNVLMGGDWRLPTQEDFVELGNNTDLFLVPEEGEEISGTVTANTSYPLYFTFASKPSRCKGMKFYKKGDHSVYLFVPAVGAAGAGSVLGRGSTGGLWSSSVYSSSVRGAWRLDFGSVFGYGSVYGDNRYGGIPLRGVLPN